MKYLSIIALSLIGCSAFAQPRVLDQAIIKYKMDVTFPENMGNNGGGPDGGGGGQMMMMGGGMESTSTIYVKGDMSKVESVSDFGNSTVITDKKSKRTTTLMESMGRKTGFYTTPEQEDVMRARMDSMRNARRDAERDARRDSLQRMGFTFSEPSKPEIEYVSESKKIAGLECKKAIIRTKNQRGQVMETQVWYAPAFKMPAGFNFGGGSGGGRGNMMAMTGLAGMDQLEGFPMEYQIERGNGFKVHIAVTKVQTDPSIDDKTFEIPKGYDIKPISDMQGGRGMMMMRMGSN